MLLYGTYNQWLACYVEEQALDYSFLFPRTLPLDQLHIYLSVDRHWDHFQFEAIPNKVAQALRYKFLYVFMSLGYIFRNKLAKLYTDIC